MTTFTWNQPTGKFAKLAEQYQNRIKVEGEKPPISIETWGKVGYGPHAVKTFCNRNNLTWNGESIHSANKAIKTYFAILERAKGVLSASEMQELKGMNAEEIGAFLDECMTDIPHGMEDYY